MKFTDSHLGTYIVRGNEFWNRVQLGNLRKTHGLFIVQYPGGEKSYFTSLHFLLF